LDDVARGQETGVAVGSKAGGYGGVKPGADQFMAMTRRTAKHGLALEDFLVCLAHGGAEQEAEIEIMRHPAGTTLKPKKAGQKPFQARF
jgi:hypothetical protein